MTSLIMCKKKQALVDLLLMIYAIAVICAVLIALQFPVVMNSPVAALAFAFLITASLGTVATVVGGTVGPLPLFALVLVSGFYFIFLWNMKCRWCDDDYRFYFAVLSTSVVKKLLKIVLSDNRPTLIFKKKWKIELSNMEIHHKYTIDIKLI